MTKLILFLFLSSVSFLYSQQNFELQKTLSIKSAGTMYLDTEDANVSIKATDRDDVYVDILREVKGSVKSNREFGVDVYTEDGNVYVKEKKGKGVNYMIQVNGTINYKVQIEIPKGVHLDIKGEDDDYTISNVEGDLQLNSEDGDISITDYKNGNIDIGLEDGDIEIIKANGNLNIELEDGDVTIEYAQLGTTSFNIEDGDVEVYNSTLSEARIRTEDGNFTIKKSELGNLRLDTEDGNVKIVSKLYDDSIVDIKTGDGDVNLITSGSGYTARVNFGDGDVDLASGYEVIQDSKHHTKAETTIKGNALISVDVVDGDVYMKHLK